MRLTALSVLLASLVLAPGLSAHCEIPCGIFHDDLRFGLLDEHIETIEKSMTTIVDLGKARVRDDNQMVRWVTNKDTHADYIAREVTEYFLRQRVKPLAPGASAAEAERYGRQLAALHELLVASMKAKQTTDQTYVGQMRESLARFRRLYEMPAAGPRLPAVPPRGHGHRH
jgi:nickel superoxide dismutase